MNYQKYLRSPEWKRKAQKAKRRANGRCELCNRPESKELRLDAHHRTYERIGKERKSDLTVLCRDCHKIFEENSHHRPINIIKDNARERCDDCGSQWERWRLTRLRGRYLCPKCTRFFVS